MSGAETEWPWPLRPLAKPCEARPEVLLPADWRELRGQVSAAVAAAMRRPPRGLTGPVLARASARFFALDPNGSAHCAAALAEELLGFREARCFIGPARIAVDGSGPFWRPAERDECRAFRATLLPLFAAATAGAVAESRSRDVAWSYHTEIVRVACLDVLAWPDGMPAQIYFRTGHAPDFLGCGPGRSGTDRIRLCRTPAAWIAAGGAPLFEETSPAHCILDYNRAESLLGAAGLTLVCDDDAHAAAVAESINRLKRRLRPSWPSVHVAESAGAS